MIGTLSFYSLPGHSGSIFTHPSGMCFQQRLLVFNGNLLKECYAHAKRPIIVTIIM